MTRADADEITKAFTRCNENDQVLAENMVKLGDRILALETRLNKLKWLETA